MLLLDLVACSVRGRRWEDLRAGIVEVGRVRPRTRGLDLRIINHVGLSVVLLFKLFNVILEGGGRIE